MPGNKKLASRNVPETSIAVNDVTAISVTATTITATNSLTATNVEGGVANFDEIYINGEPITNGATGPAGSVGAQGFTGPVGPAGTNGTAGPQGNTGPVGASGTVLPNGTNYSDYLYWNGSWLAETSSKIHIGSDAGGSNQGVNATAVGGNAGYLNQGQNAVAIGYYAASSNQGNQAIAIGVAAASVSQNVGAIAIGFSAGSNTQGSDAIAIGRSAGETSQPNNTIILNATGSALNGNTGTAFYVAPVRNQVSTNPILRYNTSSKEITYDSTSITGPQGPTGPNGTNGVAGPQGSTGPSGTGLSGLTGQNYSDYIFWNSYSSEWEVESSDRVHLGVSAGLTDQASGCVAIGQEAGVTSQKLRSVAIGYYAGNTSQSSGAVAIGDSAGLTGQGPNAVAIGLGAGQNTQGSSSIAIGELAGYTGQHVNTIVLNATGSALNSDSSGAFYVAPVRNQISTNPILRYNTSSKEVTYDSTTGSSFTDLTSSAVAVTLTPGGTSDAFILNAGVNTFARNINIVSFTFRIDVSGTVGNYPIQLYTQNGSLVNEGFYYIYENQVANIFPDTNSYVTITYTRYTASDDIATIGAYISSSSSITSVTVTPISVKWSRIIT